MVSSFLVAVATSTVLATLLNQGITELRERGGKNEVGRLSAIYAATALLAYFEQCASYRADINHHDSSAGHAGTDWKALPDLHQYPTEIDWKRLGIDLTERMFAFRSEIASIQAMIIDMDWVDPPDGGSAVLLESLTTQGIAALTMARDISKRHGLKLLATEPDLPSEIYLIQIEEDRQMRIAAWNAANPQPFPGIHSEPS